jgi:DNA-binding NarL/FixJ family response regulator
MIRVVIAEDHKLVRRGIRSLLDSSAEIEVVGEAENGAEAVALALQLEPDLVVMDIAMPEEDGITATRRLKKMNVATRVLILSIYNNRALVQEALNSGAHGYVLKPNLSAELLGAIKHVKLGGTYLSPALLNRDDISSKGGRWM